MKRYCDEVTKRGLIGKVFLEGDITPFIPFFQDLEPGHIILQWEYGDPALVKEKLGKIVTLCGGYQAYYLGRASVEEAVNHARDVVDICASDGRYIFLTDKFISFPGDAKAENIIAVNNFLKEYKIPN